MAYNAAIKSKGNVYSTTFSRDGIYMTITVWVSKRRYCMVLLLFSKYDHIQRNTCSHVGCFYTYFYQESKDTMRDFFRGPAHLNAMKTMKVSAVMQKSMDILLM